MKTFFSIGAILLVLLGLSIWWSGSMPSEKSRIISTAGIHWHPELEIFVDGERIEIPTNIGIGPQNASKPTYHPSMGMTAIHTHEDLPIIHLEFQGVVREDDIKLGKFFEIWGKDFRGFGTNVAMTVNGIENTEFENYMMHDKDEIVLNYTN